MAQTQRERKTETRARLLAAGTELFMARGIDGVSVDAVAEAASRTSGAVYAHFGNKQGLLLAVLDAWKQLVLSALFAQVADTDSARAQLAAVWDNVGNNLNPDSDRWSNLEHELWLRAVHDPEVAEVLRSRNLEGRRKSAYELERWASTMGVQPIADPDGVATLFKALLVGLEMQRRIEPDSVSKELAVRGMAALMGMSPEPAPKPRRSPPRQDHSIPNRQANTERSASL